MRGNKGEWSELYVLLKLLADGQLNIADEELHRIEGVYYPILKVFRQESRHEQLEYRLGNHKSVELYINGDRVCRLEQEALERASQKVFEGIVAGSSSSFEIPATEEIVSQLRCTKLKAPTSDKSDITLQIHDIMTGYDTICGYSIKSAFGHPPSLLNASKATSFVYEVTGLTSEECNEINGIEGQGRIMTRVRKILESGNLSFLGTLSEVFAGNLRLLDSRMEDLLAQALIVYFGTETKDCASIATVLEELDPFGYERPGFYRYKMKKLLCSVALGLMPASRWDGRDEASGGYIIVTDSGDVLAYQLYNRDSFETYLLNNTRFDTPSTKRHQFGSIYEQDGKYLLDLNLQIRFI